MSPVFDSTAHQTPVTVEFEDVDAYSIAHHSRLISYLERARVTLLEEDGIHVCDSDFRLVMVSMNAGFLAPARLRERLTVLTFVKELRSASLVWAYQIKKEDESVVLQAAVRMASVDAVNFKPFRFPLEIRKTLEKWLR